MTVSLLRAVALLVLLATAAACGGMDEGSYGAGRGPRGRTAESTDATEPELEEETETASATPSTTPSAKASPETGTTAAAPATTAAPAAVTAFTGADAFVSKLGPSTRQGEHNFPNNSPTGQACSNCHSFVAGGTIYADAQGTTPAAGVEVRVRDNAGSAVSAWTDADGNFFIKKSAALQLPAFVGVRNATTTKAMVGALSDGTCASAGCHVANKQGVAHL